MPTRKMLYSAFITLLSIGLIGPWYFGQEHQISLKISQVATRQNGTSLELASIAKFPWDRVFVFVPYTSCSDITDSIGFKWGRDMLTSIESSDSVNLIVFTQGGHVTCWFEHPRDEGDFAPVASLIGYTRTEAKFEIQRDENGWCSVVHPSNKDAEQTHAAKWPINRPRTLVALLAATR
jgi:hypothetical protein